MRALKSYAMMRRIWQDLLGKRRSTDRLWDRPVRSLKPTRGNDGGERPGGRIIRASGAISSASKGRRHDRSRDVHSIFKATLDHGAPSRQDRSPGESRPSVGSCPISLPSRRIGLIAWEPDPARLLPGILPSRPANGNGSPEGAAALIIDLQGATPPQDYFVWVGAV
jgi:hypothetical protein